VTQFRAVKCVCMAVSNNDWKTTYQRRSQPPFGYRTFLRIRPTIRPQTVLVRIPISESKRVGFNFPIAGHSTGNGKAAFARDCRA
jgi:hypothetical protein